MKVLVPCCGQSSRFPGQPPKWMLPAFDGRPMIHHAVASLDMEWDDLIVIVLEEHEQQYQVADGLHRAFGHEINVVRLPEKTASQADTVAQAIRKLSLRENFLIKDSDNCFHLDNIDSKENYICVESLNNFDSINPRNKSYVQADHQGWITNIREKVVISDTFNVGGYHFTSPAAFLEVVQQLSDSKAQWQREIYISDIIGAMILSGTPFRARQVTGYQDWGTIHEWKRSLSSRKARFILLDGFLFERGSQYFSPRFADVRPNSLAVEAVKAFANRGDTVIYLSIRPPSLAALTQQQLDQCGAPHGQVVYDCAIAPWQLITSPHPSLPFRAGTSIEVDPLDPNLEEKLRAVDSN